MREFTVFLQKWQITDFLEQFTQNVCPHGIMAIDMGSVTHIQQVGSSCVMALCGNKVSRNIAYFWRVKI